MAEQRARGHLHEIDVIRTVTALCVVGVHAVSFTVVLAQGPLAQQLQNAGVSALHFTREIFIAITAFVLVYSYGNRPFSAATFWRKRGIGVLLPYVAWTLFYDWRTKPPLPLGPWLIRAFEDVLSGNASFQLYFILLTLEFYLVLPWFLRFMAWAGRYPWRLLAASLAVQLALLYVDYRYVQAGPLAATNVGAWLGASQNRLLPLYQLYMVVGGLAALYLRQVRVFMLRHGAWTVVGLAAGLALLWGNFAYQVDVAHRSIGYAITVFQPSMALYALGVSAFLYWVAYRWAISRAPAAPRGQGFWLLLSNASFGIYLMHAYVLDVAMHRVVPNLPGDWPEALRVLLVWALVAGVTTGMCCLWLYIPGLSRLIGRSCALRRDAGAGRWLDGVLAEGRIRLALAVGSANRWAAQRRAVLHLPRALGAGAMSEPAPTTARPGESTADLQLAERR